MRIPEAELRRRLAKAKNLANFTKDSDARAALFMLIDVVEDLVNNRQ